MTPLERQRHLFVRRKLASFVAAALSGAASLHSPAHADLAAQALRLPVTFERNDGQFPADVLFVTRAGHGALGLKSGEFSLGRLGLRMSGANPAPEVEPERPLVTRSHYYNGGDPVENVPHYGELRVKDVYPGIDLQLHGRGGQLEYDFIVAPGADPRDIRIDLRGAERASLDARGNLQVERDGQLLEQRAPVAYQGEGAKRRNVEAHFEIVETDEGPQARIALAQYEAKEPLTIDPVLVYSTYAGASGSPGMTVKTDSAGRVYYADRDAFATSSTEILNCLDPTTNTLVYQTHFGGTGLTDVNDIALDANGTYVAGSTSAPTFPVAHTPAGFSDVYVAKFNAQGQLAGGFTFGGSSNDNAQGMALDAAGNIYITGNTNSADFPKTIGPALNNGANSVNTDAFVAKYTSAFTPVYRRLIGGDLLDLGHRIVADGAGRAIVAGETSSSPGTFPLVNPGAPVSPAPTGLNTRGFVAKLEADGTLFTYLQYIGGASIAANAVALDPTTGDAIVVGRTNSATLVPASPRPATGGQDGFVVRVSPSGVPLSGTLLGGNNDDNITAVAVNSIGDVFVAGATLSPDFPMISPLSQGTSYRGGGDAFVARLRANTLEWSTYLGGTDSEALFGLALDGDDSLFVSGYTRSGDFPLVNSLHPTKFGTVDGYVSKITGVASSINANGSFVGIATRALVLTGDNVVIGGFAIGGSTPKTVVVRARGPSLGVAGALADPTLTLVPAAGAPPITNDDWQTAANAATLAATGFQPGNAKESAILARLAPGGYTAIMSGAGGARPGTGIGIVEVYEVDHPEVPLMGISTRAFVGTADNVLIGSFAIEGTVPVTVIVRARGPSLASQNVTGALADPVLTLVRASDNTIIGSNDNWQSAANAAQISALGLQPADARESAVLMTLDPGAYTAIVGGVNDATGVAIVEVFVVQ